MYTNMDAVAMRHFLFFKQSSCFEWLMVLLLIWMLLLLLVDTLTISKNTLVWAVLAAIKTNCQSRYTNVLKQEIYIEELLLDALFSVSQKAVIKPWGQNHKISPFKNQDRWNLIRSFNDLNLFYKWPIKAQYWPKLPRICIIPATLVSPRDRNDGF